VLVPDVLGALIVCRQNIGQTFKKTPRYVGAEDMMTKKEMKTNFATDRHLEPTTNAHSLRLPLLSHIFHRETKASWKGVDLYPKIDCRKSPPLAAGRVSHLLCSQALTRRPEEEDPLRSTKFFMGVPLAPGSSLGNILLNREIPRGGKVLAIKMTPLVNFGRFWVVF